MTNEHITYVQSELDRGVAPGDLQNALLMAGYQQSQIDELFAAVQGVAKVPPTPPILLTNTLVPTVASQAVHSTGVINYQTQPAKTGMPGWLKVLLGVLGFLVLAILVLVFIVMSSLNVARDQGMEAGAKQSISNVRSMAEIHYSETGYTYTGMCENATIQDLLSTPAGIADCVATDDTYRVSLELLDGDYYCIDATGFAKETSIQPNGVQCESAQDVAGPSEDYSHIIPTSEEVTLKRGYTDSDLITILNLVRFDAELYYNENNFSYSGFCDSAEGVTALEKLESPDCFAVGDHYRINENLLIRGYYCVDSSGFAGEIWKRPLGPFCELPEEISAEDKILQQAEKLIFADTAKVMRQYYEQNEESYDGACDFLFTKMPNSGLNLDCVAKPSRYRVSSLLSDGWYHCIAETLSNPGVTVYDPEINILLQHQPVGFYCT